MEENHDTESAYQLSPRDSFISQAPLGQNLSQSQIYQPVPRVPTQVLAMPQPQLINQQQYFVQPNAYQLQNQIMVVQFGQERVKSLCKKGRIFSWVIIVYGILTLYYAISQLSLNESLEEIQMPMEDGSVITLKMKEGFGFWNASFIIVTGLLFLLEGYYGLKAFKKTDERASQNPQTVGKRSEQMAAFKWKVKKIIFWNIGVILFLNILMLRHYLYPAIDKAIDEEFAQTKETIYLPKSGKYFREITGTVEYAMASEQEKWDSSKFDPYGNIKIDSITIEETKEIFGMVVPWWIWGQLVFFWCCCGAICYSYVYIFNKAEKAQEELESIAQQQAFQNPPLYQLATNQVQGIPIMHQSSYHQQNSIA